MIDYVIKRDMGLLKVRPKNSQSMYSNDWIKNGIFLSQTVLLCKRAVIRINFCIHNIKKYILQ